jgi:hypothetical protein
MITLVSVAITMIVGLVSLAYGQNISLETEFRINYRAYMQEANEICFPIPDPAYDATHNATAPLPEEKQQCYDDIYNKHGLNDPKYEKIDRSAIEMEMLNIK